MAKMCQPMILLSLMPTRFLDKSVKQKASEYTTHDHSYTVFTLYLQCITFHNDLSNVTRNTHYACRIVHMKHVQIRIPSTDSQKYLSPYCVFSSYTR